MRFYCPMGFFNKQWFIHIFFQETGRPHRLRVGKSEITFGRNDPAAAGQFGYAPIEVRDENASIEMFPGCKILAIVASPTKTYDENFAKSLTEADMVEFTDPKSVITMTDMNLALEVAGNGSSDSFRRQVEVVQGKRRRFNKK